MNEQERDIRRHPPENPREPLILVLLLLCIVGGMAVLAYGIFRLL